MLNIYYGRESVDKEAFLFDKITKDSILITPDQFTLEMERELLKRKGNSGIFDMEVLSFNRLGDKILNEVGGNRKNTIDKYGRHMLLTKIALINKEDLDVYKGFENKASFINMLNNFISELKQAGISPDDLQNYLDAFDKDSLTHKKIKVIKKIYEKYEEEIEDKYIDSEDKLEEYISKISKSNYIKNKKIFIYGFDSFSPKAISFITELINICDVSIILTYDKDVDDSKLFELSEIVIDDLLNICKTLNKEYNLEKIGKEYTLKKEEGINNLEENLFKFEYEKKSSKGVRLIEASNISNEAETVASIVLDLVKNKGYKLKDIRIICNDPNTRVPILKRMFYEYGIRLFSDEEVPILDSDLVQFVITSLEVIEENYRTDLIIKLLKSGFCDLDDNECLELENYSYIYKIKGSMWKKDFTLGRSEFRKEEEYKTWIDKINSYRSRVISYLKPLEEICKEENIGSFIDSYLKYLHEDIKIDEKIDDIVKVQDDLGREDLAQTSNQIIEKVENILIQIKEILSDTKFELSSFIDIFKVGLSNVSIGLLPPTVDGLVLGNAIRSRFTPKKVVIVYGGNQGIFPKGVKEQDILSNNERLKINELGIFKIKSNDIRRREEEMGIYRNLSRATDMIFLTYSLGNEKGEKINKSEIYQKIEEILDIKVEHDVIEDNRLDLILNNQVSGKRHLMDILKKESLKRDINLDNDVISLISYFKEHDKEFLDNAIKNIYDINEAKPLGDDRAEKLYFYNDIKLSPSSLEKYMGCPFSFFVSFGLKPKEKRVFEIDARNFGNIYHHIFKRISEKLTDKDIKITDLDSQWMNITEDGLKEIIDELFVEEDFLNTYGELILSMPSSDFLIKRYKENIFENFWVLILHVRKGNIIESHFEEKFGNSGSLPPIKIELQNGKKGYITGIIDRYDVLPNNKVKIIDYKTGNNKITKEELEAGYKIQLFTYYEAAKNDLELAGMYYFHIIEPSLNNETEENKEKERLKEFIMDGIYISNNGSVEYIDNNPSILPRVSPYDINNDGSIKVNSKKKAYGSEEFKEVEKTILRIISNKYSNLVNGDIRINPIKYNKKSACIYCAYKNICRFDNKIFNNSYNIIKEK